MAAFALGDDLVAQVSRDVDLDTFLPELLTFLLDKDEHGYGSYPKAERDGPHAGILATMRAKLEPADGYSDTKFILPDGTRLRHGSDSHWDAAQALGSNLHDMMRAGVLRFTPGTGGEIGSRITDAQAQHLLDAARYSSGNNPLYIDVFNGKQRDSKEFDYSRVKADAVRHWVNGHFLSGREFAVAFNLGGEGSGNFGHAGRPGEQGGSVGGAYRPVLTSHRVADTLPMKAKSVKHAKETVEKYGLTLNKIKKDPDGYFVVEVEGGRDELDKFSSEMEFSQHADTIDLGGEGSGNFGHAGRPGEVGGSASDGGSTAGHGDHVAVPLAPDLGRSRPTPIQVKSVAEAVGLILQGKVVELQDVSQVHTVLTKLADMAQEAKAKGEKAQKFDLCNVSVKGSNLFCGDKLRTDEFPNGVPRMLMPQFAGKPTPGTEADKLPKSATGRVVAVDAFVQHLKDVGIKTTREDVPAASLRATQMDMKGEIVAGMMTSKTFDPADEPMFISRDNYVVDGHHRWAAVVGRDAEDGKLGDSKMKVVRIDAPISELLHRANRWAKEFGLPSKSLTTPSSYPLRGYAAKVFSLLDDERFLLGGTGSGNFGHAGRPGEVGGSGPGGGPATASAHSATIAEAKAAVQAAMHAKPPLQPLPEPKIPAPALEKAQALVASETEAHKVPVEQVLDLLDGNSREQFDSLLSQGKKADAEMTALVSHVKTFSGLEAKQGPMKTLDRAVKKVVGKDTGDARNVRDIVRSSVIVDKVKDIDHAITAVHEAVKAVGGKIVTADDRFSGQPTEAGYRDFSVNVKLPSGIVGEVQIHLKAMLEAKEKGGGHDLYKQSRKLDEKRTKTDADTATLADLLGKQKTLYGKAWLGSGGS